MTIRQFAALCACNPQTLRYYDRADLLKPARVDPWTGYRSYKEEQARGFVKIRNLQKAGFTIGEIRELLDKDQPAVLEALDGKLREAARRLREIREIRQSYQTEMDRMQGRIIGAARDKVLKAMAAFEAMEEFGISRARSDAVVRRVEGGGFRPDAPQKPEGTADTGPTKAELLRALRSGGEYALIFEKQGWERARDILPEFPALEDGGDYALYFERPGEEEAQIAFANVLTDLLGERCTGKGYPIRLQCDAGPSADGLNHIRMYKRRLPVGAGTAGTGEIHPTKSRLY